MAGMSIEIVTDRKERIIECHNEVHGSMKNALNKAIEAGQLLTEQKEELSHGEFLPWLKENVPFSEDTAERYIKLNKHYDKIRSVRNLQEAYRQIETIEQQEKLTERQKSKQRVQEYRKTNIKPEGWKRGTDDKLLQEEYDRDRNIEEFRKQKEKERRDKEERQQQEREQQSTENEFFTQAITQMTETAKKRQTFKERIRVSHEGVSNQFVDALMDYMEELEDDNRRIQFCYDVIKVCKNIAVDLQRKG